MNKNAVGRAYSFQINFEKIFHVWKINYEEHNVLAGFALQNGDNGIKI